MSSLSPRLARFLKRRWVVTACVSALAAAAVFGMTQISAHPRSRSPHYLSLSVATAYGSLNQLGSAASSVAVLQATGTTSSAAAGGVPATVTQMTVKQTLAGAVLPATVGLYQLGSSGVVGADVVEPNQLYIAYLTPYQNGNGPVAGQWTIVGGEQGLYVDQASGAPTSTTSASGLPPVGSQVFAQDASSENPAPPSLPTTISIAQATASLGAGSSTTTSTTPTTTSTATSSSTPSGSSTSG